MSDSVASDSKKAWNTLVEGNNRFLSGEGSISRKSLERLPHLAQGQTPKVCVITCSDSRVSPEIIFDAPLGELFVIRVAGGVLDRAGLGSLHYAAAHLGVELVVVLGHSECGLVKAACGGTVDHQALAWMTSAVEAILPKDRESCPLDTLVKAQSLAVARTCRLELAAGMESPPQVVSAHLDFACWKVEIVTAIQ
jgi:carbonic anhydrase